MSSKPVVDLVGGVAAAIDALLDSLTDGAVRDLTHAQCAGLLTGARRAQARLESAVLTTVGEVDARGSHVHDGALSAAAWLRQTTRATPEEASATARTARVLRTGVLPATAAALAAGKSPPATPKSSPPPPPEPPPAPSP